MKYKELIKFDPIISVIELVSSGERKLAENIVKSFVFSEKMQEDIKEIIIKNLIPESDYETKGIQIVGSYGTGKSHLMSLVACIAENEELLNYLNNPKIMNDFKPIAGKYKVLRFEVGTDKPLKDVFFSQVERYFNSIGIAFSYDITSNFSWKESFQDMMAEFEEKYPTFHFLVVIDELLEYLKGKKPTDLSYDLMLLRQLGEFCNKTRFKLMFGVQELLYRSPEFQFQAEMLNKIEDRYADLIITKEDVSFVVKERLLKKDLHQKEKIREHLLKFAHLFEGINTKLNDFVDLFPVHPSYISSFERIKHGKSQREILKVLSSRFIKLSDSDVPNNEPGLITYDSYWLELENDSAMLAVPDIRTVKDKIEIIYDRINNQFTGARAIKKELALKIVHALAIKILYDDLYKHIGDNTHNLKEDLCATISGVYNPDLLLANVESTANLLVKATSGQYIDRNEINGDFYIRTEGGINIPQQIKDYSDDVIKRDKDLADQYYFDILQYILGIQQNTYRTGFKIWEHSLEWLDKKSFRLGYIFFGNPNERSTTEPIQQYYIFFCPLFNAINRNDDADEVYFDVSGMSDEFKEVVCLYGAAKAKHASASSNHKQLFASQIEEHLKRAIALFDKEYTDKTIVIYNGTKTALKNYSLLGEGASKEMIFKKVASKILNKCFNDKYPDYPAFVDLPIPLSKDNFDNRIKAALKKIANPSQANRDGEAILGGLGLWSGQNIITHTSKYADSIQRKIIEAGSKSVINRADIIWPHYADANLWYSIDYKIDYQLEFLVLVALAYKGDIEIFWSGNKSLSATNIDTALNLNNEDFFTFQYIKQPQGIPIKQLKTLFSCLGLPDYTSDIEKPQIITEVITQIQKKAEVVAKTKNIVSQGIKCKNISLVNEEETSKIKQALQQLLTMLDSLQAYNTYGKLKTFRFSEEELTTTFHAYAYCAYIEKLYLKAERFEKYISYLGIAKAYVIEDNPLFEDINKAILQLPDYLSKETTSEIKQYEALLISLKDRYADYYLQQYTKYRLSATEALAKERLMLSDKKKICDILKDSDFISSSDYTNWIYVITSLKEADISLSKVILLTEPYHDFNPRDYYNKPAYSLSQLEDKLEEIFEKWLKTLHSFLKDPTITHNMELLKREDVALIEKYLENSDSLNLDNALKLRALISQLAQGIDKVEIKMEDFKQKMSKPLSPQEAIETFTQYIDSLCLGKERNKVRILVK